MADKLISTRPPSETEKFLKQKFAESIVAQNTLLDELAKQLITLELAIPGAFAAIIKLVSGDKATIPLSSWLSAAFGAWFLALVLTLVAITPRNWKVNPNIMKQDPAADDTGTIGIEDFFHQSATYKRRWLIAAMVLFFAGIIFAVIASFQ